MINKEDIKNLTSNYHMQYAKTGDGHKFEYGQTYYVNYFDSSDIEEMVSEKDSYYFTEDCLEDDDWNSCYYHLYYLDKDKCIKAAIKRYESEITDLKFRIKRTNDFINKLEEDIND